MKSMHLLIWVIALLVLCGCGRNSGNGDQAEFDLQESAEDLGPFRSVEVSELEVKISVRETTDVGFQLGDIELPAEWTERWGSTLDTAAQEQTRRLLGELSGSADPLAIYSDVLQNRSEHVAALIECLRSLEEVEVVESIKLLQQIVDDSSGSELPFDLTLDANRQIEVRAQTYAKLIQWWLGQNSGEETE